MKLFKILYFPALLLGVMLFIGFSCSKQDNFYSSVEPGSSDANKELYEIMNVYYYWYEHMPSVKLSTYNNPAALMDDLIYKPVDKWSFVASLQAIIDYYESGESKGYGTMFYLNADSNQYYVAYIYKDSPLYQEGVRRGWQLLKINDIKIDSSNFSSSYHNDQATNAFTLKTPAGKTITFEASKKSVKINSILFKHIYQLNTKKVGYMVLESFIENTESEVNTAFAEFKAAGVDELIIDLRYNGGGLVDVAKYLASLIAADKTKGNVFFKYLYNNQISSQMNGNVMFLSDSIESALELNKLFVITTKNTASASELIINGLMPYIDVKLVGEKTHGKPVGMNIFEYEPYAFIPVVFETVNANNEGKYYDGINVDYMAEDEYHKPWGDSTEASLYAALSYIDNGSFPKKRKSLPKQDGELIGQPEISKHAIIKQHIWKKNE